MTTLFWSLLGTIARRSKANFIQKTRQADAVQEGFLRSLLQIHQNTEFGQQYKLSDIKTIDQFRERIPIQPYSSYQPLIERMATGENNVLVSDRLLYFNLTSGSTGRQKLVPVTKRSRRAISRANWAAMGFAIDAARQKGMPLGKILFASSAKPLGQTDAGIAYGPVSTSDLRLPSISTKINTSGNRYRRVHWATCSKIRPLNKWQMQFVKFSRAMDSLAQPLPLKCLPKNRFQPHPIP
ncbi:MAG: GH3 auxin-responsive promoter family protein [Leptolyngbyaceae cyanobacterium RM1_406_9]|nr:GH3 auxin-responsive promoter family protein [Leptolyngbyaceae cyanobacterium RM1_406_9]